MLTTHFKLFYNTPNNSFSKYQHFENEVERDKFYDSGMYESYEFEHQNFNQVRDKLTVRFPLDYDMKLGLNYCYFWDERAMKRYYCFISHITYVNERVVQADLTIDVLTTYFQGDFATKLGNVEITRQHLTRDRYNNNIQRLSTTDYLSCGFPSVIHQEYLQLGATENKKLNNGNIYQATKSDDYLIIMQSACDLSKDFGNVNEPKLPVSAGNTYDNVYSPLNLYIIKNKDGQEMFKNLEKFPWIAQTIKQIRLIPADFIDNDDLEDVNTSSLSTDKLMKLKNKKTSNVDDINFDNINIGREKFGNILKDKVNINLIEKEPHLFNNNYFNIVATNFLSSLEINPQKLPDFNLIWGGKSVIGYKNNVTFFIRQYNSRNENLTYDDLKTADNKPIQIPVPRGEFGNNSISFQTFDEIPIYIDNYNMSLANNAYKRKAHNDYRLDNQVKSLVKKDTDNSTRLYNAMSVVSNLSPSALANNFRSEYEYYRDLKVEQEQARIQDPTITEGTYDNSWLIRNALYGISEKIYAVPYADILNAYKYHRRVGYDWNRYEPLESVTSMSLINYVQFKGEYVINDIPKEHLDIAKILFEDGVSIYHNKNKVFNPYTQDVTKNERVK